MSFLRILVIASVAWLGYFVGSNAAEPVKHVPTVLLFGDSIIAGYGLGADEVLSVQLQKKLKEKGHAATVINGGVSGDTTAGGRTRLAWTLKKHKPDVVFLALGGNDLLRGIQPELTAQNMEAMVTELKSQKITTILSGVEAPPSVGPKYREQFNAIYTDLAKRHKLPLYPFLLTKTFAQKGLMQGDQIHPSSKGVEIIANGLADYLIKNHLSSAKKQ